MTWMLVMSHLLDNHHYAYMQKPDNGIRLYTVICILIYRYFSLYILEKLKKLS